MPPHVHISIGDGSVFILKLEGGDLESQLDLIDVLRGISISLVMILHFHLAYRLDYLKLLARNGN